MNYEKQRKYQRLISDLSQQLNALKAEAEQDFEKYILENGEKITKIEFSEYRPANYNRIAGEFRLTSSKGNVFVSVHKEDKDKPIYKGQDCIPVYRVELASEDSKYKYLKQERFDFYINYMAVLPLI